MGSGKSLHLLATAHNFQEHSIPFLILKSSIDNRDGEGIIHSRALGDRECVTILPSDNIFEIISDYCGEVADPLRWLLIDEAQFLTPKQVEELAALADVFCVNILCYGLRTDFKSELFPGSKRLFEIADCVEEIKSSCYCGSKTIMNARINSNKEIVTDGEQIEIGGDDRYVSLCRKCYFTKAGHPLYNNNNKKLEQ